MKRARKFSALLRRSCECVNHAGLIDPLHRAPGFKRGAPGVARIHPDQDIAGVLELLVEVAERIHDDRAFAFRVGHTTNGIHPVDPRRLQVAEMALRQFHCDFFLRHPQIQLAAMKQNPCPVVGEVAKPTGVGLDELDGAVESFSTGIADSVLAEVEQPRLMTAQHLDDLLDGLQSAAHGVVGPSSEEPFGSTLVAVAPELGEVLFDAPGPAGLEVELIQGPKRDSLSTASIGILLEPRPFASSQWRRAGLGQPAVLLASNRIDCLAEVLGDVELVMHDVGLGHARFGSTHEGWPHIHGHRFDRRALSRRECFQQRGGCRQLSLRYQIENPGAVNVGQDAGIAVAFFRTLLVNAQIRNFLLCAAQHASFHGADHDAVDRAPGKARQSAHALGRRTDLKQLDHKAGHQGGDAAVALGPGHSQLFDSAVAVLELGHACLDEGFKLAGIQVSPLAFAPAVDMGSLGGVRGVRPHLVFLENNLHHDTLICQRKIHRLDRPRRLQSKKVFVQHCVFHGSVNQFVKLHSAGVNENSQRNR